MPSGMFDGIIFDQAEDDLPPTPAPRRTPPPLAGEQLPIDHQLGSLTTTIQKLQDDAAFYRAQVPPHLLITTANFPPGAW